MKTKPFYKVRLWRLSAFCFVLVFIFGTTAQAIDDPLKGLSGPPFSNPSKIQPMPPGWEQQPVKYEQSAGNADIVLTLDQQMNSPLIPIVRKYAKEHNLKIIIINGTCGISGGMLSRKVIDIGGYCCAPGETDRLPGLKFHTLGIAPLALIVHPDNPIDNITIEQGQQLFQGEIYRWSELKTSNGKKGANLLVQPVVRLHCKIRPGSWRLLLKNEDLFSPSFLEVGAIPDMISQVSENKEAIGYEVIWETTHFKHKGKVKTLRINGYDPENLSHLLAGHYPLYRVYSLTTWEGKGVLNTRAKKLVDYLIQQMEHLDSRYAVIPASRLRQAGWKFKGNELVGKPR